MKQTATSLSAGVVRSVIRSILDHRSTPYTLAGGSMPDEEMTEQQFADFLSGRHAPLRGRPGRLVLYHWV